MPISNMGMVDSQRMKQGNADESTWNITNVSSSELSRYRHGLKAMEKHQNYV